MTDQLVTEEIIPVRPRQAPMGRLTVPLKVTNPRDPSKSISTMALVDTGAAYITLPAAWRERLGDIKQREVLAGLADGSFRKAWFCAPVEAEIDNLSWAGTGVLFLDTEPDENGEYEALIGYNALQEAGIAVDLRNDRLVPVPYVDVK